MSSNAIKGFIDWLNTVPDGVASLTQATDAGFDRRVIADAAESAAVETYNRLTSDEITRGETHSVRYVRAVGAPDSARGWAEAAAAWVDRRGGRVSIYHADEAGFSPRLLNLAQDFGLIDIDLDHAGGGFVWAGKARLQYQKGS